jgi:GDP-4-dehydro-6-deoxy-D-mannose reductase
MMRDVLEELLHLSSKHIEVSIDPSRFRPNDLPILQGDATRIRTELRWTPRLRVEQTLRDTLDWWRQETSAGR